MTKCALDSIFISHIDEIIDDLLQKDRVFDIILPRLVKRSQLEKEEGLEPYMSPLQAELDAADEGEFVEGEDEEEETRRTPPLKTSLTSQPMADEIAEANAVRAKLGLKPLK